MNLGQPTASSAPPTVIVEPGGGVTGSFAMMWQTIDPQDGQYSFVHGARYAALASVSKGQTLDAVTSYLSGHGWTVTYAWEQGTPTRGEFAIDDWLASLAPDPNTSHRWVYLEVNRDGPFVQVGVTPPWPLSIYSIADVMMAVPAPPGTNPSPAPPSPGAPSAPAPSVPGPLPYILGGLVLASGLAIAAKALWRLL